MDDRPTFLSTFSGVGGMDLGLERAGWRCVGQVESDPWRRAILARHWPDVPRWDDVRSFLTPGSGEADDARSRSASVAWPFPDAGSVDLICGGFPCQDLSVAGKRRGLAGARSGLFFEFARIADALRPDLLLIENVPGLLSSNGGRDFGVVLGTLADIGYGVAWRVLDSRYFGVPQRRRRVFIVGAAPGGHLGAERAGQILSLGQGCDRHLTKGREARSGAAGTLGARSGRSVGAQDAGGGASR